MTFRRLLQVPLVQRVTLVGAGAILVAALIVLLGRRQLEAGPGEARLEVDGLAEVIRVDGAIEMVSGVELLRRGDQVSVLDGSVRLVLGNAAVLDGRTGWRDDQMDTAVRIDDIPELMAGELLVEASDGVTIAAGGNEIELARGDGAMRVSRSLAVEASTYRGLVTVDSAGQPRLVPAYRRLAVAVLGSPPARPRPLVYDETDPWDLRLLGEWIALGSRLDRLASSYSRSIPSGEGRTIGFFQLVLPDLGDEEEFTQGLLHAEREPGETLVGAAITEMAEQGSFVERWREVFSFRDEGAAWGLVSADQEVRSEPLLGEIEAALNATSFEFAAGPGSPGSGPGVGPGSPGGSTIPGFPGGTTLPTDPAPGDVDLGDDPGGGGGLPPPPGVPSPPPPPGAPPPDEDDDTLDDVVDAVEDLIGGLLTGG
ncbi:MAG: hypothetical protein ACRD29_18145 [Acidimicrobiales bacterium]